DYLRGDMWGRVNSAASNAGVPIWTEGQVWLLVPETHIQKSDSSIEGGVALGASGGSGIDGGIGMVGSNGLALFKPESLTDNRSYNGLTIPDIGPLPLKQDVSYVWFEGTTISSLASSYLGAGLHEMTHGFGMPHDFRNDDNFDGNLLGNGLRGMRGAVYPELYPNDDTFLSYGQAMALSTLPYFSGKAFPTDRTAPNLSVQTSGSVAPVDGLLQIRFSASDANGLACALLTRNGDQIGEMPLSGTSVSKTFATPYYTPGQTDQYTVLVYDKNGNRRTMEVSVTPTTTANRAVQPFVELSTSTVALGKPITLDASRGSDPESGGMWSSKVEWDLNGDGVFDTEPSASLTLTKVFTQAGTRLIQARITDAAGAVSLSAPIGIRVVPTVNDGAASNTYYVRVDPDDASVLEVFRGSTPVGTPAYTMFRDDARPLTINSGGGTDELIVDFANGNPVPAAGVKFDGGTGSNRIRIVGTSSADGLAMTNSQILAGSLAIDYAHANIQLGRSDTTLTLASLDLQASARVALASGGVLELHSLAIASQASLDLQDGDLLLHATAETRRALCDQIARWIANARGNGTWGGNGLTSGVAAGNPRTGLAITINDKGNGQPIFSTFDGLPTDANDILIKYTWNGDVNLDGKVDLADYFLVDSGFIQQAGGYRNGDLDLNGKVDLADYFLIDSAFIAQNSVLGVPRAVWAD
ncbi:MAG TPA: hypothetical protein VHP11_18080, partial [Tepidisphaeraceae bacterium]|nr:hypothetical protein [Tepidisphaeraceae bacterium]